VAVFTTWLDKCAQRGEISLPDSVETTAGYIDAQLNLILNRIAAGENPETVRKHATLAFRILTEP
jgi:hypothetical protein